MLTIARGPQHMLTMARGPQHMLTMARGAQHMLTMARGPQHMVNMARGRRQSFATERLGNRTICSQLKGYEIALCVRNSKPRGQHYSFGVCGSMLLCLNCGYNSC